MLLLLLLVLVYESGAFQDLIDPYMGRGMEESGRGKVWPLVLERISDSPWAGVGLQNIYTFTSGRHGHNPHNGLLFLALSSGIIPLMCFIRYLVKVGAGTRRIMNAVSVGEDTLIPPLAVFGLVLIMFADFFFMSAWVVVVFAAAAAKSTPSPRS
jgi:O-antigen ligase